MRTIALTVIALLALGSNAPAQTLSLKPELAGIGFLVGHWAAGVGKVVDTRGTSTGTSIVTTEVGGSVLVRRDHTDLKAADGTSQGSFEQIMMIYPEGGTLHADYSDGQHIIHYTSAEIVPGTSVTFTTTPSATAPEYRLRYVYAPTGMLSIHFDIQPPGQTTFRPIASGTLQRS